MATIRLSFIKCNHSLIKVIRNQVKTTIYKVDVQTKEVKVEDNWLEENDAEITYECILCGQEIVDEEVINQVESILE